MKMNCFLWAYMLEYVMNSVSLFTFESMLFSEVWEQGWEIASYLAALEPAQGRRAPDLHVRIWRYNRELSACSSSRQCQT